jgi:hypothetical protein
MPFLPHQLTPAASLNRAKLVDLPALPQHLKNKTGFDLLSSQAICALIEPHRAALHIAADAEPARWPLQLDAVLADPQSSGHASARQIADELGTRLGYFLWMLKQGDAVHRAARREWDPSVWEHWQKVRQVWLGGGIISGSLGQHIATTAHHHLQTHSIPLRVAASPYAPIMPLVGCARYAPLKTRAMLVFDFGNTFIKRGYGLYQQGRLQALRCFAAVRANTPHAQSNAQTAAITAAYMVQVIRASWRIGEKLGLALSDTITISLATYLRDNGTPHADTQGLYSALGLFTQDLTAHLEAELQMALGTAVQVRLLHDGTAAAIGLSPAIADTANAAVLLLGTTIGVGYVCPMKGLRNLADAFNVQMA